MNIPTDLLPGTIHKSRNFGKFEITSYRKSKDITITFINTGYVALVRASQIRSGEIKDLLKPTVMGVGFYGVGNFPPNNGSGHRKHYITWRNMIVRCYNKERALENPTYKDCTVDPTWHNFQNFAEWFDANYIEGYHLDKDIKIKGNKVYGPSTCIFVSQADNTEQAHAKSYLVLSPSGVETKIYNMSKFCRENNLGQGHMTSVCKGNRKSHKGWTRVK